MSNENESFSTYALNFFENIIRPDPLKVSLSKIHRELHAEMNSLLRRLIETLPPTSLFTSDVHHEGLPENRTVELLRKEIEGFGRIKDTSYNEKPIVTDFFNFNETQKILYDRYVALLQLSKFTQPSFSLDQPDLDYFVGKIKEFKDSPAFTTSVQGAGLTNLLGILERLYNAIVEALSKTPNNTKSSSSRCLINAAEEIENYKNKLSSSN